MESASRKTAEAAAKAAPEPADTASCKPADRGSPEPADMATPKPADGAASKAADMAPPKSAAGDEITPNPAYVTASATKASSEPSTTRSRAVCRRAGQGSRNGKNCGCVQYRTQRASSRDRIVRWRSRSNWRAAECGRSDCGLESADPNRCSGSLRALVLSQPGQPPRQL